MACVLGEDDQRIDALRDQALDVGELLGRGDCASAEM
jgi:hypothetical protein